MDVGQRSLFTSPLRPSAPFALRYCLRGPRWRPPLSPDEPSASPLRKPRPKTERFVTAHSSEAASVAMGSFPSRCRNSTSSEVSESESSNPFEETLTKKERAILHETWRRLTDPKAIVGQRFLDIVGGRSELKTTFGVHNVPRLNQLTLPKMGAHVKATVDFLDSMTLQLGYYDNLQGAWQMVKKMGRAHGGVPLLADSQPHQVKDLLEMFTTEMYNACIPYCTGDKKQQPSSLKDGKAGEEEKKRVTFGEPKYPKREVEEVWARFWQVVREEMFHALQGEKEKKKKASAAQMMAPQWTERRGGGGGGGRDKSESSGALGGAVSTTTSSGSKTFSEPAESSSSSSGQGGRRVEVLPAILPSPTPPHPGTPHGHTPNPGPAIQAHS